MITRKYGINSITLMSSAACNLSCSYCAIAQNSKLASNLNSLQKNTIDALDNGTFLQNCKLVLNRIRVSPQQIEDISFWGREPSLTLKHFSAHLNDWLEVFPNINHLSFSTNGVSNVEDIVEFVEKVSKSAVSPIDLGVQFSYDGEYSTKTQRGIDPSIVKNNLIYFLESVSKLDLTNVKLHVNIHGVMSFQTLHYLDQSLENVEAYNSELKELWDTCSKIVETSGQKEHILPLPFITIENPYKASVEDGEFLYRFLTKYCDGFSGPLDTPLSAFLYSFYFDLVQEYRQYIDQYDTFIDFVRQVVYDRNFRPFCSNMSYCNVMAGSIKILYDGTQLTCHESITDFDRQVVEKEPDEVVRSIKLSTIDPNHNKYFNFLTATQEEINKMFKFHEAAKKQSFMHLISSISSLMVTMAQCGQISEDYCTDSEKLIKHAFIVASKLTCQHHMLMETGSVFYKTTGFIRMMCNGVADIVCSKIEEQINIDKLRMKNEDLQR